MRSPLTLTFVTTLAIAAPLAAQPAADASATLPLSAPALAELRRERAASVVGVTTRGYRPVAGLDGADPRVRYQQISGSGFAIDGGLIVTSSDLLVGAERVDVVLPAPGAAAARTVAARLIGIAPEVGVALLAIESDVLPPLPLASGGLADGQAVFALSAAGALPGVTATTVDAVAMPVEPGAATAWIQTRDGADAMACGGPLVDAVGALVGMTTCPATGRAGAGYAVPAAVVALTVPHLGAFGHLHRARLGLATESVSADLRAGLGLGTTPGLLVADVARGGPADRAGLQPGDLVTAIGGLSLADLTTASFTQHLLALDDGDEVPVTIERGGRAHTTVVTATVPDHECARPDLVELTSQVVAPLGIIGLPVEGRTPGAQSGERPVTGVAVFLHLDGDARGDGLARGDIIRAVNGDPVATPAQLTERLARVRPELPVVLQVERDGALTYVTAAAGPR
ncbi:MAG: PDZ domain-containing protein [Acidobacteria bacterium]|nr:PDZ domain-containing protein [Acidobacteriota bacterium]